MKMYLTDEQKEALAAGPGSVLAKDLKLRPFTVVDKISKEDDIDDNSDRAMITTVSVDRDSDVVVPEGGELGNFRKNPVVLFGHNYWQAEKVVGRSKQEILHAGQGIEGVWQWADIEGGC